MIGGARGDGRRRRAAEALDRAAGPIGECCLGGGAKARATDAAVNATHSLAGEW